MNGIGEEQPATPIQPDDTESTDPAKDPEQRRFPAVIGQRLRVWRESVRARPMAYRFYRTAVGVVGGAIVLGGLALVPLPGPGWVIVFLGLAVLATEFVWADRLERFARNQVRSWTTWLGGQAIWIRILFGVGTLIVVAAVLYALFAVTGVPGWVPDSYVNQVPGL